MKNTLFLFILSFCILSCSAPEKKVVIDNPIGEKTKLTINGKVINLKPRQTREVTIKFGDVEFIVNDGTPETVYLDGEKDYLINPLKETYYVETLYFFMTQEAQENFAMPTSKVEGVEVNGDFKAIENQIAIAKTWRYGLDEEPSGGLGVRSPSRSVYKTRKIHRKEDIERKINDEFSNAIKEYLEETETPEE